MKIIVTLFFLFGFSFCSAMSARALELTGAVKSESGKPLNGVKVLTYAPTNGGRELLGTTLTTQRYEVTTDQNGYFRLPSHGRLVYFKRDDLRPLTKILDLSASRIEVTMEEGAQSLWKIPLCSSLADNSQRFGIGFRILVPENMLVKKATQFENGGYLFGYDVHGNIEVLINWSTSTSLEPDEAYFLGSKEFSERAWVSGKTTGYETRGVKSDGKVWRRVSFRWGAITYQGNSKEAAESFDRLIDGMCFEESKLQ
jgi:hypothetical protein